MAFKNVVFHRHGQVFAHEGSLPSVRRSNATDLAKWGRKGLTAALVAADPIFNDHRKEVIAAENANKIGAMHQGTSLKMRVVTQATEQAW